MRQTQVQHAAAALSLREQQPSAVRLRWSNRVKCLMCYLVCFALPLLWQAAASLWIYPSN